jgi:hypothetical protein
MNIIGCKTKAMYLIYCFLYEQELVGFQATYGHAVMDKKVEDTGLFCRFPEKEDDHASCFAVAVRRL